MPSSKQSLSDFDRIAAAIGFLQKNITTQPDLDTVATFVGLSPFHFQRMFTRWAGVSPKKFLQYLTREHAKQLLENGKNSVLSTSAKTGLSAPSRLHDLFVTIEAMTPGEYGNGGAGLAFEYSFTDSIFGKLFIATTSRGVSRAGIAEDEMFCLEQLQTQFPRARFTLKKNAMQQTVIQLLTNTYTIATDPLHLHIHGTPFQLKVWEALLRIPIGSASTYGTIAESINHPNAYRAVGTAVGQNPIAILIPCHRVIQASGALGNYYWGSEKKAALIGWEMARRDILNSP